MIAKTKRAESVAKIQENIDREARVIDGFGLSVEAILTRNPAISPVIHSFKKRSKSRESIAEKIKKKRRSGEVITSNNIFKKITDLYAVRLIHLYPQDISVIHKEIVGHAQKKDWILAEKPKAYTWDPESKKFLEKLGLDCEIKPSYYTSVHYLVKPRSDSLAICEIQVRSLLEEVWGEIDHKSNYKSQKVDSRVEEHLAVLARLVGAGSRLISALYSPSAKIRNR